MLKCRDLESGEIHVIWWRRDTPLDGAKPGHSNWGTVNDDSLCPKSRRTYQIIQFSLHATSEVKRNVLCLHGSRSTQKRAVVLCLLSGCTVIVLNADVSDFIVRKEVYKGILIEKFIVKLLLLYIMLSQDPKGTTWCLTVSTLLCFTSAKPIWTFDGDIYIRNVQKVAASTWQSSAPLVWQSRDG